MTVTYIQQTFNEERIVSAIGHWFDYARNRIFPNVMLFGWESDLLVVTPSRYLWEIEVKCTLADWRSDSHKDKWKNKHWENISRFYYAVPENLLVAKDPGMSMSERWWESLNLPEKVWEIPAFVPSWAGVLALQQRKMGVNVRMVRHAQLLSKLKISDARLFALYHSTYFRFWRGGGMGPSVVVHDGQAQLLQSIADEA
jgi:hypothetical protein